MSKNFDTILGFSVGDPNGVGIEVILKSLTSDDLNHDFKSVLFSNYDLVKKQSSIFDLKCNFKQIENLDEADYDSINIINIDDNDFDINFGQLNKAGGEHSYKSLLGAVNHLKKKEIHGLITAPINKNNIQSDFFKFKGHTDFLESCFDGDSLMFMVSENLKVALLTEHIPINEVANSISSSLIEKRIHIVNQSLKKDFGIKNPKIAMLSINPHVGDGGVIGNQDDLVLIPTTNSVRAKDIDVSGPYASDSFFGSSLYKSFDAVVAAYHDQGLIPFKTMTFGNGVNFTAGLEIVRTSPDHGTAYDIAGKNIANPQSFKSAIIQALSIIKNRKKN